MKCPSIPNSKFESPRGEFFYCLSGIIKALMFVNMFNTQIYISIRKIAVNTLFTLSHHSEIGYLCVCIVMSEGAICYILPLFCDVRN